MSAAVLWKDGASAEPIVAGSSGIGTFVVTGTDLSGGVSLQVNLNIEPGASAPASTAGPYVEEIAIPVHVNKFAAYSAVVGGPVGGDTRAELRLPE